MQQVRVLIFVHSSDLKFCLDIRLCVVMCWKKIGWMALLQSSNTHASDLETNLQSLQTFTKEDLLLDNNIDSMLASIAAHVLCGHVREYRPLLARLSDERTRRLAEVFDGSRLETPGQAEDVLNPAPWFRFETQANAVCRPLSLQELGDFDHISKWSTKEMDRNHKLDAFDTKTERTQEVSNLTSTINILKCDAETHTDDIESTSALRKEMSSKDKLMIRRMRKYKLFPTAKQRKKLQQFMGTCRWTYNQAVAHFRETNVSNAQTLRDLYVTKKSKKKREYVSRRHGTSATVGV
ncbi:hypothetical protein PPTG_08428 [Phytophthora nicotianae INRA-310]|uniref:Transposase putative helix-turn-helix domain-containing protein n=1 Tax=Phytophthora nicotianae (strain INRA-310) TaxID=761204 RepID=W2QN54_PHYN3|nr:hypothetical protein PPTG_08428 [Phytophthora nicotianae INRA-310]ETN13680.1 hypothetical protein PPTG_08428 [Phytophthora nicotianae INRA-310]